MSFAVADRKIVQIIVVYPLFNFVNKLLILVNHYVSVNRVESIHTEFNRVDWEEHRIDRNDTNAFKTGELMRYASPYVRAMQRLLCGRLGLIDTMKMHPEIEDERIEV